jgi:hypothetical protein
MSDEKTAKGYASVKKRKIIYGILGGIVFAVAGAIMGLLAGITIGGNYFVNFEFAGTRGYEAAGLLGALIGLLAGMILGVFLGRSAANLKEKKHGAEN